MPTFDTPEPISVSLELGVGDVRIEASDRADTIVEVRPSDPAKKEDVAAAEQTRVEYASGHLLVKSPSGWRQWSRWGGHESIDVFVGVPAGSRVNAEAGVATVRCRGTVGEYGCKVGVGDIQLDEAGPVDLKTGVGDITVERAIGKAEIVTGSGAVRIGSVEGAAVVKNSNGDTRVGGVTGEARLSAANGNISVDLAHEGIVAKTAKGDVRLGEVERGAVVAQSAFGNLEIGVRDGIAAWLDLQTRFGDVRNELEASESPGASENAVEVHATTSFGDITVRRSVASRAGRAVSGP
jgi:putative adhesin